MNYYISVLNKNKNEYIEEISKDVLLNSDDTLIRHNNPGEWFYIDQSTLPILKIILYNLILLDSNDLNDIALLKNIEGYLLEMKILTYDTVLTLVSKLIITQINTTKYNLYLGVITDDLLIKYIKILSTILMDNPKYKFIIDLFIMATREIYKKKNEYNKKIINTNNS